MPIFGRQASAGKETTKQLIVSGAVVDAQHLFFGTALQRAAEEGDYETVELLIDAGADVNATPGSDRTALALAIESNKASLEKVRLLLEHGADANGEDQYDTPFDRAVSKGRPPLFLILLAQGEYITTVSVPRSEVRETAAAGVCCAEVAPKPPPPPNACPTSDRGTSSSAGVADEGSAF
jgi:ankyrin repeat protein